MDSQTNKPAYFWGIVLIAFGLLFLLNNINVLDFGNLIFDYWPVFIILIGVYIIIKNKSCSKAQHEFSSKFGDKNCSNNTDSINESNTFGDVKIKLDSKDFQGGSIRTTFGDTKVDLSAVEIKQGEHKLFVNTTFGDIKIRVPADLAIKVSATNLAGDIDVFDQSREGLNKKINYVKPGYQTASAKLFLLCSVTFGDIVVD